MDVTTNGHAKGRSAIPGVSYPEYRASSGYTLTVRRLSPDLPAQLQQAAMRELAESEPPVPTQRAQIAPDQWAEVPMPTDAAYVAAKHEWDAQVRIRGAQKLRSVLESYAVLAPEVDADAVAEYRALMEAQGIATDETDRQVWLWRIVCPTTDDQIGLMAFAIGRSAPSTEAIAAQKAMFRSDIPGA